MAPNNCFGFCKDCGISHSLPSARAVVECHILMRQLQEHGRIDFETPLESADSRLSTDCLYSDTRGKMMGVLVSEDASGREVVLRAFSSKYNGLWNVPGWVPPLMDAQKFTETVAAGDGEIHPLTEHIDTLDKDSSEWRLKVAERRCVSLGVLAQLHALYEVNNFRSAKKTLADSLNREMGIPVGTGDCCAPKLLNHAAKNGWKPVSIAEFFWGKSTLSGDRLEGQFYAACMEKCQPLLGFMLCGGK